MITALKSNQLDGVEVVPPTSVATLKAAHFVVRSSPGVVFDDFIINSNPQQQASHKELLNPLLRQAFDDAIDRQAIVKTSLLGHGQPGASIIPPATGHWSDPAIKPAPFDLAKANQLLDQAGYKMGPGGVRMANGHPMSYTVIMPTDIQNSYGQRSYQIIQGDFKKIGVQLNLKVLDDSAAYSAITANGYKNFEISMWDWYPLTDPDFMLSVLTCGSWNVWNDTGYCSKTYDNLYQAQSAATNPAKRQQIVYQMQADDRERQAVPGPRLPGRDRGALNGLDLSAARRRHLLEFDVQDPVRERAPGGLRRCAARITSSSGGSSPSSPCSSRSRSTSSCSGCCPATR